MITGQTPRYLLCGAALVTLAFGQVKVTAEPTPPAGTNEKPSLQELITRLGDENWRVRSDAGGALALMGRDADDLEARRRRDETRPPHH